MENCGWYKEFLMGFGVLWVEINMILVIFFWIFLFVIMNLDVKI